MGEQLYTVGKLVNTHGVRGEVKIVPQTDFPEERFAPGSRLVLVHPDDGRTLAVQIAASRMHKQTYIAKFRGYDDINDIVAYKGWLLKVAETERAPLEEGEYYYSQIISCTVVTDEGETLGEIKEILAPGANHVWVVARPKGKDVLLPVIDDVVLEVDVEAKRVRVHLLEGLID